MFIRGTYHLLPNLFLTFPHEIVIQRELSDVFPEWMLSGNAGSNQIFQEKMGRTNPNPFLGHQIYISTES